jgi:hypothetical protein
MEHYRPMLGYLKTVYGAKPLIGAEIGVFEGEHAAQTMKLLNMQQFYLVDSYETHVARSKIYSKSDMEKILGSVEKRFSDCPQVHIFRQKSLEFAEYARKKDFKFDFVYIDACHEYEAVLADIKAYYPLIRVGGVLGGHDFSGNFLGVVKAVVDFVSERGLTPIIYVPDWWLIKED